MYLDILWSLLSMMHAIDWSDTLVSAAGGEPGKVCRMGWGSGVVRCSTPEEWTLAYHRLVLVDMRDDGVSQWTAIAQNSPGPRTELVYNFDPDSAPKQGHAAIRYKYI